MTQTGIYLIEGPGFFTVQIVAYGEIADKESCKWLKLLTRKLKYDDAVSFMQAAEKMQADARLQRMAESVMEISIKENSNIFARIAREKEMLKLKAFRFLFEDEINKARVDGEARGEARGARGIISLGREFGLSDSDIISRIVSSLKCSLEEAIKLFHAVQADCKPQA